MTAELALEPPRGYTGPPDETPLVSCLLVVRKGGDALMRAIDGFARQDYPNLELVVVDRATGDAREHVPREPGIRYVRAEERGAAGAARALAFREARGAVFAEWSERAWYVPWRISVQVADLMQTGLDVSGSAVRAVHDPSDERGFRSEPAPHGRALLAATLCFTRGLWARGGDPAGEPDAGGWADVGARSRPFEGDPLCVLLERRSDGRMVDELLDRYGTPAGPAASLPLVSCVMPTFDRREFVPQAVKYFLAQDYPNRELIVVDDGPAASGDLLPADERVTYVRLNRRATIGAKRNLACEVARGEVIIQWDDDDWYGPARLRHQVDDLVDGRADMTGIVLSYLLDLRTTRFFVIHEEMPVGIPLPSDATLAGGTLAYTKEAWKAAGGYPDQSLGEDVGLLHRIIGAGGRVLGVRNWGTYAYVRHGANSWRFEFEDDGPRGWVGIRVPDFVPDADLAFFRRMRRYAGVAA